MNNSRTNWKQRIRDVLPVVCTRSGVLIFVIAVFVTWIYWPTLLKMVGGWSRDPIHTRIGPSHGGLVPIFALVVLWCLRDRIRAIKIERNAWGIAIAATGLGVHFLWPDVLAIDALSLLPVLVGLTVLFGGWDLLRVVWPALALLLFSLPWPYRVEIAVSEPLRYIVADASTYLLQTFGYLAYVEGTTVYVNSTRLDVIHECSGLGMLVTFVALAVMIAILRDAPLLERSLMVAAAVPIAIAANIARVTFSCMAYVDVNQTAWTVIHDVIGWLMMPLALGMLWLVVRFIDRLLIPVEPSSPLPIVFAGNRATAQHP